MNDKVVVGISDIKVVTRPGVLISYALGSCVGICLYDSIKGVAGMSHVLLPDSKMCPRDQNVMKFADTAIEELILRMLNQGAAKHRLTAKIAGGAQLFGNAASSNSMRIGDRNVEAVKEHLGKYNIKLLSEDTGLNYGRTVQFNSNDGVVIISSALKGIKSI